MYKWTTALQWRVAALKAVFFFYFDFYAFILYAAVVKIFFWEILISSFFSNLLFNPNKFSQLPLLLCAFSSIAGGITCVAYTVQKLRSSILQQIAKGAKNEFCLYKIVSIVFLRRNCMYKIQIWNILNLHNSFANYFVLFCKHFCTLFNFFAGWWNIASWGERGAQLCQANTNLGPSDGGGQVGNIKCVFCKNK